MFASLPMYDRPELAEAHDVYWGLIRDDLRAQGQDAPERLEDRPAEIATWTAPDLLLGQTCGYPFRTVLHDRVGLIGTPDYGVPGCPPGFYRSCLVVRAGDPRSDVAQFRDDVLAVNDPMSQSGLVAVQSHVGPLGFRFERRLETGSHLASMWAVASGRAGIAGIDAVTFALTERHDPVAADLKVLARTRPTPGLPYIANHHADRGALFGAVSRAIVDLPREHRDALMIRSLVALTAGDYLAMNG